MSILTVFEFDCHTVRIVSIDGEPWFVAKDVCNALGILNVSMALKKLDTDEKIELPYEGIITLNDDLYTARLLMISESGMYTLVLRSRKPEAKLFRKWITSEVLPSIRKTGSYSLDVKKLEAQIENLKTQVRILADRKAEQERKAEILRLSVEEKEKFNQYKLLSIREINAQIERDVARANLMEVEQETKSRSGNRTRHRVFNG